MSSPDCGRSNDSNFNGEWLRKATVLEDDLINIKDLKGSFAQVWYQLDLSSKVPLQEEHVKTALMHLYRKTPNLRCCFGVKKGHNWIKRCSNPNVDFQVIHGMNVEAVRDLMRDYTFNTETGPVFCARLLQDPADVDVDPDDIEPTYPHKSHMIFGINHVIVDGTTNMHIMGFFITLLNDVIANKTIDGTPLGIFLADEEMNKLFEEKNHILKKDPELRAKILKDMKFKHEYPALIGNNFQDHTVKEHTISLVKVLDRETTTKFLQKCKQEKVTVNSAFSALSNVTVVDTLAEHGIIKDSYVVQNFHCVNIRRHYEIKKPVALGCHMDFPLMFYTETPVNIKEKFWDYTRLLNQDMKNDVQSGRILLDRAFRIYYAEELPHVSNILPSGKRVYESDYVTTNMGDITSIVSEGGEHVRITNISRGSGIHAIDDPLLLNCHTFRGRWTMIFEYNERAVKDSIGRKMSEQYMKRLYEFIE